MAGKTTTVDGNEAAARIAYKLSEVIAIYPITPSSAMGELADQWAAEGKPNLWGNVPRVVEMQSEGGAAGAIHGAAMTGALSTTFTASQGLLLMLPNMFKIAGELSPVVIHVAARAVAAQALSIFGDHSDVMAARATGFAMLCSGSVQEAADLALVAHAAALRSRLPFMHFFDGFRTSHELQAVELLGDEVIRALIREEDVNQVRRRALSPDHPSVRGTAQNPDVFFQARESSNSFYGDCPSVVQKAMDELGAAVGRHYRLFDYVGHPQAERVIVMMGSGADVAHEAVERLLTASAVDRTEKVGLLKVRLFRPFAGELFVAALPKSVRAIAVLDRTKEPGSAGEPLYQDVVTTLAEAQMRGDLERVPRVIGGRYGLSSKEFTPAMVKGVFDELELTKPKPHFTVGIKDDVTHLSIPYPAGFDTERQDTFRSVFIGLGSDGTVSANKNSIKIIGEATGLHAQAYFVYDSKKAGAVTVSHLRFGKEQIRSSYLIKKAKFVACHQWQLLERIDCLSFAADGAVVLLNSPYPPEELWGHLPREVQQQVVDKNLKLWTIDAYKVAQATQMGRRINTVMQVCFFAISGVLPREEAIAAIRVSVKKTYGGRGEEVVKRNFAAIDGTLEALHEVQAPRTASSSVRMVPPVPKQAPTFVQQVTAEIIAGRGDDLPVSLLPNDGVYPLATTQWEKRNLALEIPVWDMSTCIQCNKCALVCPHAAIRAKLAKPESLQGAPATLKHMPYKGKEHAGMEYLLQVAPEDCTGCQLCVEACPAKNKSEAKLKAINMTPQPPLRDAERDNYSFFLGLPELDRREAKSNTVKGSQFLQPLFEYSGACSGCGETPYLKLLSQLYGDRLLIANATGCSSIYGGNLPTTPWAMNKEGRGVAWANSLFEDNAEFGLGFRLTVDQLTAQARALLETQRSAVGEVLAGDILGAVQTDETLVVEQRRRVVELKRKLSDDRTDGGKRLLALADYLVRKSVWIVGGDGWAYDIGYGGLDHVLASGQKVNILVLDTEVYSNTGGQASKSTPRGAVAKFAAAGKPGGKKDLGMLAMSYGTVYVAQVAMGASDQQTVRAFLEAEAFPGPSLIIAYSHCIAHGIEMSQGLRQQQAAVDCGHWPLYRFVPNTTDGVPLKLDSKPPKTALKDYTMNEARYRMLAASHPERAAELMKQAQLDVTERWKRYEMLAGVVKSDGAVKSEGKPNT